MVQPTLQEISLKEAHKSFSSSSRGPAHKPRTRDKPELRQNELNTFPHQLKVGDKVLLDAAVPYIVTTTLNEEIPLTVLSIFPFSTVKVSHPKFSTFKVNNTCLKLILMRMITGIRSINSSNPHDHSIERLLSTATQESSLTLIGQMSLQGISSMLSMRMIKKRRGIYPPQYRLTQSTEEEAYEDILDDLLPQYEDPLTQPPPPSCPQTFQHLYISSPVPPREPSNDEDDLWTNEPLPLPEYPPPPSRRLFSKTPNK
ncbi:hypothetical protein GOBAR_AA25096 [Gossypium barbadense]|uniref:Uncharacterized protein n=1 Tax=Gossypium barbadense TaxID=3634 RepID=A0A2P5WWW0_GOSBA|nr:hypothetical protein GOBAR_AA25096 [Gossypium barbadense]